MEILLHEMLAFGLTSVCYVPFDFPVHVEIEMISNGTYIYIYV